MRIAIIALLLSGCAAGVGQGQYTSTPSMQLCASYLNMPSWNVWQAARAEELAKRGEDCSQFAGAATAKRQSDQQAYDNVLRALTPPPAPPPPPAPVVCRQTYMGMICQ